MRFLFFIISFLFISSYANCAWININSGINDELTSISFSNSSGVGFITGKKRVEVMPSNGSLEAFLV